MTNSEKDKVLENIEKILKETKPQKLPILTANADILDDIVYSSDDGGPLPAHKDCAKTPSQFVHVDNSNKKFFTAHDALLEYLEKFPEVKETYDLTDKTKQFGAGCFVRVINPYRRTTDVPGPKCCLTPEHVGYIEKQEELTFTVKYKETVDSTNHKVLDAEFHIKLNEMMKHFEVIPISELIEMGIIKEDKGIEIEVFE